MIVHDAWELWRQYLSTESRAVIVGAALAFVTTWLADWWRSRRRRIDVASAIVCELRHFRRLSDDLVEATTRRTVLFARFSQDLFRALIPDIADMKPDVFIAVRLAYVQCAQVDFLRKRFEREDRKERPDRMIRIGKSYTVACKSAAARIDEALSALRQYARPECYDFKLPPMDYSGAERAAIFENR